MSRDYRNYYGLPVALVSEDPKAVDNYARSGSRGDFDVGRFGLALKVIDSDPYWAAVIYQSGKPIAIVDCMAGKGGLLRGLQEDDPETLKAVFRICCDEVNAGGLGKEMLGVETEVVERRANGDELWTVSMVNRSPFELTNIHCQRGGTVRRCIPEKR
jgi:hypothetical protein